MQPSPQTCPTRRMPMRREMRRPSRTSPRCPSTTRQMMHRSAPSFPTSTRLVTCRRCARTPTRLTCRRCPRSPMCRVGRTRSWRRHLVPQPSWSVQSAWRCRWATRCQVTCRPPGRFATHRSTSPHARWPTTPPRGRQRPSSPTRRWLGGPARPVRRPVQQTRPPQPRRWTQRNPRRRRQPPRTSVRPSGGPVRSGRSESRGIGTSVAPACVGRRWPAAGAQRRAVPGRSTIRRAPRRTAPWSAQPRRRLRSGVPPRPDPEVPRRPTVRRASGGRAPRYWEYSLRRSTRRAGTSRRTRWLQLPSSARSAEFGVRCSIPSTWCTPGE